jgi:predicted ATPase
MPLTSVTIQGYRSVQGLRLPVDACSVFVGANGVGKTNLYKAVALLHAAANSSITRAIAEEGGIESVLWAGERMRGKPVRLVLKAHFDELDDRAEALPHSYAVEIGLPAPTEPAFRIEPLIKAERLAMRRDGREIVMMERKSSVVTLRNEDGRRETHKNAVLPSETALSAFRDSARYPELEAVRQHVLDWRLYHDFRTDAASLVRQPCHAITTPTLSSDGRDLERVR